MEELIQQLEQEKTREFQNLQKEIELKFEQIEKNHQERLQKAIKEEIQKQKLTQEVTFDNIKISYTQMEIYKTQEGEIQSEFSKVENIVKELSEEELRKICEV